MIIRRPAIFAMAALAFAPACSLNAPNAAAPPVPLAGRDASELIAPRGPHGKISHIVVIVQENRSFEDFFAGYPGANAPMSGCGAPPLGETPVSPKSDGVHCPPGDITIPLRAVGWVDEPDGNHDWGSSMVDWNNGKMDGFTYWGKKRGRWRLYVYQNRNDVKPYWTMAQQYVLADEMFPTEFGGSFTGHLTLVAGTDDLSPPGKAEVDFPTSVPDDCDSPPGTVSSYLSEKPWRKEYANQGPYPCFDQFNTIAQVLDKARISWKIYATQTVGAGAWEPFEAISYVRCATYTASTGCVGYGKDWSKDISAPQTNVLKDARNGRLASVSWVTPSYDDSDHPVAHKPYGPSWVSWVVNSVGDSKYWSSSAIIVVWDDWGGSYDNVPPPQLDYRGLGIRVPCLIISPYAKQGYVSHVQYEWGSILRFIEETYGLPAGSIGSASLGYTDARASSLDDAFDFSQSPRQYKPIHAPFPLAHFLHEPASDKPVDTQ